MECNLIVGKLVASVKHARREQVGSMPQSSNAHTLQNDVERAFASVPMIKYARRKYQSDVRFGRGKLRFSYLMNCVRN